MNQKHDVEFFVILFFKIVALALGILLIYWLTLKVTGHSPTTEQLFMTYIGINTTITLAITGFLFKIQSGLGNVKSETRELKAGFKKYAKYTDLRLTELSANLSEHNTRLTELSANLKSHIQPHNQ